MTSFSIICLIDQLKIKYNVLFHSLIVKFSLLDLPAKEVHKIEDKILHAVYVRYLLTNFLMLGFF